MKVKKKKVKFKITNEIIFKKFYFNFFFFNFNYCYFYYYYLAFRHYLIVF